MRLLFITLDAAFQQDAERLLSLPHLGALADRGVFCDHVQTIYPSLTYPIHASLVTGCYPDRHGIGHNELFSPDLPAERRPWHWLAKDIQVETLFQAGAKAGREIASLMWPVSGQMRYVRYNMPEVHALPNENQVLKALSYGSTWWLLRNEFRYGRQRLGFGQPHLDGFSVLIAQTLIDRQYNPGREQTGRGARVEASARRRAMHMPDMMFLHLVDLDASRHKDGVHGPEAEASLVRLDTRVGQILNALEQAGALEDTLICIASDHGQQDISDTVALDAWLRQSGLPARAQTLGLGAYIYAERGAHRQVQEALQAHMKELKLKHVYTRQELQLMHAPTDVHLAVEAEDGVEIVDNALQEPHRATHGFGPAHPAAQCLLWLAGPGILEGARLHQAQVVNIAPTLAKALRLSLPQAQGRVLKEVFAQ